MSHWVVTGCIVIMLMTSGCTPQNGGSNNGGGGSDAGNGGTGGPIDDGPAGGDIDVSEITGPDESVRAEIDSPRYASAIVTLPSGVNLSLQSLRGVSGADDQPVGADGGFDTLTYSVRPSLVSVVDANDNVVLFGFINSSIDEEVSVKTTATALIYLGMGGWALPPDELYFILLEISELDVCDELANVIAQEMRSDPLAITNGSDAINTSLAAALEAMVSGEAFGRSFAKSQPLRSRIIAPGDPFLVVDPLTLQSGISLLLDSSAPQLSVVNHHRRPAVLYRVQTGYDNATGEYVELPVVEPIGDPLELSGGNTLTISGIHLSTLFNTETSAVWEPTETGPIEIPAREGATRTYYDLVVLGPSFDGVDSALLDPSRYAAIRSEWQELLEEQRINMFVLKFMMPLAELFGMGVGSAVPFDDQAPVARTMRQLIEPILDGAGVSLHTEDGYFEAIEVVLERWASNRAFREDLTAVLIAAYGEELNRDISATKVSAHMKNLAGATNVRSAVLSIFDNDNVTRLLSNLRVSDDVAIWSAETGAVKITPSPGRVTENYPFVDLTASVAGSPAEPLTYEWTSSAGIGGFFTALDDEASVLTTTESTVTYSTTPSAVVGGGTIDTVTVRVVDANGTLLGTASAKIRSNKKEDNPCPDFVDEGYSFGDDMDVNVSSNVILGGQDVFVEVTYNFPSEGIETSQSIEVFMSAVCPRCEALCRCDSQSATPIYVDGEPAINREDRSLVRWQGPTDDTPGIEMTCAASGEWRFTKPEGANGGAVSHTFQLTVADDWPGCPLDEPDCSCPRLTGATFNGEVDFSILVWRGYFIAVRSPTSFHIEPIKFDTNPLYESLASCSDN
ncbi:MAG: hypothetical protein DHS20C16_08090 [Phycisphaerae bacterium]|nr:MAG: hypothetical protein DHS20C16_08090 [Phycisphaerae bacterium]